MLPNSTAQTPIAGSNQRFELVGPSYISVDKLELLNKINGHGLQIKYRFTRAPHLFSAKMVSIELTFYNDSHNELENIHISDKSSLPAGVSLNDFATIAKLSPGQSIQGVIGVDFNDSTQTITFGIKSKQGNSRVSIKSTVGEMIRAIQITEQVFREEQSNLRGMNEHTAIIDKEIDLAAVRKCVLSVTNVGVVFTTSNDDNDVTLFAGQTMSSQSLVLISIEKNKSSGKMTIVINCEKMVIGSMLLNEIKSSFKK